MRLKARINALEQRNPPLTRWHQIIVQGEPLEHARARYEAEHGPIGEHDGLIVRRIVSPA